MRLSQETDNLHLGLCGNLKRPTAREIGSISRAAVLARLGHFGASIGGSNLARGNGSVGKIKEDLVRSAA